MEKKVKEKIVCFFPRSQSSFDDLWLRSFFTALSLSLSSRHARARSRLPPFHLYRPSPLSGDCLCYLPTSRRNTVTPEKKENFFFETSIDETVTAARFSSTTSRKGSARFFRARTSAKTLPPRDGE